MGGPPLLDFKIDEDVVGDKVFEFSILRGYVVSTHGKGDILSEGRFP